MYVYFDVNCYQSLRYYLIIVLYKAGCGVKIRQTYLNIKQPMQQTLWDDEREL